MTDDLPASQTSIDSIDAFLTAIFSDIDLAEIYFVCSEMEPSSANDNRMLHVLAPPTNGDEDA